MLYMHYGKPFHHQQDARIKDTEHYDLQEVPITNKISLLDGYA